MRFDNDITSCDNMFYGSNGIIEIDLSNFYSSNVLSMNSMFRDCTNLTKVNFGNIDTSKVESMQCLFMNCKKLESVNLSDLDTSSLISIKQMFSYCTSLKSVYLKNFKATNVKDMEDLFANCAMLTSVNLSSFDTSNVETMKGMFYKCDNLKYLDIAHFTAENLNDFTYAFYYCNSLIYINLKNFKFHSNSNINVDYAFAGIKEIKYCVEDSDTKSYLFSKSGISFCCTDICFQENAKIDLDNNQCYETCPQYTILLDGKYICMSQFPENSYYDNDEQVYKECYYKCKTCEQSGNDENNNCNQCKENFQFFSDSKTKQNNCYDICDRYYYFNEMDEYKCAFYNCPSGFNKLVPQKSKCIDDCNNDDEYKIEYDNICMNCPQGSKIDAESMNCIDKCDYGQIEFKNMCYNELPLDNPELFKDGYLIIRNNSIFNNLTNELLSLYSPEEGNKLLIELPDETLHQITNSINELESIKNKSTNSHNVSIIDLAGCEIKLKKENNISENDSLIFIKREIKTKIVSEKNVQLDVFNPYNKEKLNLSTCEELPVNMYLPMMLSKEINLIYEATKDFGYNMFNINDSFYQDICTPFDSVDGTDILLIDRIDYIYHNNDTKCQSNCEFSEYSIQVQYISCICFVDEDAFFEHKKSDKFDTKKLYESFYEVLKYSNYDILKCYKKALNFKTMNKNFGSIMVIFYIFCCFICFFIYIYKGLIPLKIKLRNELYKEQKKYHFILKVNINKILYPPIKKKSNLRFISPNHEQKYRSTNNNNTAIKIKKKRKVNSNQKSKKSSSHSSNHNVTDKDKETDRMKEYKERREYSDNELNELEYEKAIKLDKRTFCEIYRAALQREHLIIFTFFNCNDYNLLSVKISRFIFLIVGDMAFNVFFFSDDSMHKLFLNYGKYDFIQQIPQITYSTIISQIIELFICFLSLTDKYIYQIKSDLIDGETKKIKNRIKCIHIKLINFFIFIFLFLAIYWYIITIFCGVYKNTQIAFFKDSIISFAICLIYPLVLYFISAFLRFISLTKSKKYKCIYNLSYIIPIF